MCLTPDSCRRVVDRFSLRTDSSFQRRRLRIARDRCPANNAPSCSEQCYRATLRTFALIVPMRCEICLSCTGSDFCVLISSSKSIWLMIRCAQPWFYIMLNKVTERFLAETFSIAPAEWVPDFGSLMCNNHSILDQSNGITVVYVYIKQDF